MPAEDRRADNVLLGVGEFRLLTGRIAEGEVELTVATAAGEAGVTPAGCAPTARSRYATLVRDLDCFDRAVRLR